MKTISPLVAGPLLAALLTPLALADPTETMHQQTQAEDSSKSYVAADVAIERGEITLAATVLMPEGKGPHPGVVVVPGSGPHPRTFARTYAEAFANAGFAVISYDKRGSGESTGNWVTASLVDLAGDASMAMRHLAEVRGVDSERIGLWAPSQGAWVTSVMHSQGVDIAFLAVMSGGGVTPRVSETYSYEMALKREGANDVDRAEAASLLDAYFDYLASGNGRDALVARIEAVEGEPWYAALNLGHVLPSETNRPNWAWVANYDPLPSIETMIFPVLLLFGSLDEQQPTMLAVDRWKQGLEHAGNQAWCAQIFPGANHMLRTASEGGSHNAPLAEGLLDITTSWLRNAAGMSDQAVGC